jgi:ribosomal protein S18 acetylase RimI-like enzyme
MSAVLIRRLAPGDAAAFKALRLSALQESPTAFASSVEEEKDIPLSTFEERLAFMPDQGRFGAFDGDELVGVVALGREGMKKLAHKAIIWGMYMTPACRGRGIGKALLLEAIALARTVPGIQQINLIVNADNQGAVALYEALGFNTFGREANAGMVDGALHDDLHMCLHLAAAYAP